jgi:acyl carrier protein
MKATLEEVKRIFAEEVDATIDVTDMDPTLNISDFGIDSLDRSSIFLALDDAYGVSFTDDDIQELDTLNKIIDFINKA